MTLIQKRELVKDLNEIKFNNKFHHINKDQKVQAFSTKFSYQWDVQNDESTQKQLINSIVYLIQFLCYILHIKLKIIHLWIIKLGLQVFATVFVTSHTLLFL
jgi:hypothetical protein